MVIIRIQHYKIPLLAYFDAADTIRPVQGSSPVQGEGGDSFFNSKMHIDTCQGKSQRNGTGETTAGLRSVARATAQPESIISRPRA